MIFFGETGFVGVCYLNKGYLYTLHTHPPQLTRSVEESELLPITQIKKNQGNRERCSLILTIVRSHLSSTAEPGELVLLGDSRIQLQLGVRCKQGELYGTSYKTEQ